MLDINLPGDLEIRLASLARVEGRSPGEVALTAIGLYVEANDEAFRAEARRQSKRAADRGWTEEDHYWESRTAFDNAEPPAMTNAAE